MRDCIQKFLLYSSHWQLKLNPQVMCTKVRLSWNNSSKEKRTQENKENTCLSRSCAFRHFNLPVIICTTGIGPNDCDDLTVNSEGKNKSQREITVGKKPGEVRKKKVRFLSLQTAVCLELQEAAPEPSVVCSQSENIRK